MTSNTTPSGEVIPQYVYSAQYDGYMAFDDNAATDWIVPENTVPGWIRYHFPTPICIKHLAVTNSLNFNSSKGTNCPKDCYVKFSNDGTTWTSPINFTNPNSVDGKPNVQDISNSTSYSYVEFGFTTNYGHLNTVVNELQFYGE